MLALPSGQRQLLLSALAIVASVRAALCLVPSRFCVRLARRLADVDARSTRGTPVSPERIAWAVSRTSRLVPGASCLTQAIAGQLLLRRHGYGAKLCIGVTRAEGGEFLAHAWLEREGRVLLGGAESAAFTRMPALTSTLRRKPTVGVR